MFTIPLYFVTSSDHDWEDGRAVISRRTFRSDDLDVANAHARTLRQAGHRDVRTWDIPVYVRPSAAREFTS